MNWENGSKGGERKTIKKKRDKESKNKKKSNAKKKLGN